MGMDEYSYAQVINEFVKLSNIHNYNHKLIGYEKFRKIKLIYPLYKFTINPQAKTRFCIVAGVHGDEVAGTLALLKLFKDPKFFKKEIKYEIFPVINPSAFDLKRRYDDDNRDLNCLNRRTLRSKNYREIQAFYNQIKKEKFGVFISMHEDLGQDKTYEYIFEKEREPLYRRLFRGTKIWKTRKIYTDKSDGKGMVINGHDQSLEDRIYGMKKSKISLATETPGKLDIKKRISMNLKNLKILNEYLMKQIRDENKIGRK